MQAPDGVSPPLNDSPFLLPTQHVDMLSNSTGFAILRDHLAQHYTYELCDEHTLAHRDNLSRWLIVRDALHAMLVPVVELFDKSVLLAATATQASKLEDLEYAYSGEARSAFLWLQCFLSSTKEREWCFTRGCPACVVEHTLDSEFSIRLLYAACLLSDVHYPFTIDGPTLPSFMFFLDALERAVVQDPLFGPHFLDRMHPKALATRNGIEELIRQCVELDNAILSQPDTPATGPSPHSSEPASPVLGPLGARPSAGKAGLKVRRSRIARRQMSLQIEEEQWMEEMLKRCWEQLDGSSPIIEPGDDDGEEGELVRMQALEAVVKESMKVAVTEVSPME